MWWYQRLWFKALFLIINTNLLIYFYKKMMFFNVFFFLVWKCVFIQHKSKIYCKNCLLVKGIFLVETTFREIPWALFPCLFGLSKWTCSSPIHNNQREHYSLQPRFSLYLKREKLHSFWNPPLWKASLRPVRYL
jgi:hypothetical protein